MSTLTVHVLARVSKQRAILPLLALSALATVACHRGSNSASADWGPDVAGGYAIRGEVFDASTKKPVEAAQVSLKRDDGLQQQASTDSSGAVIFHLPPAAKPHVAIEVQKSGYTNYFQHVFQTTGHIPITVYLQQGPAEGKKPQRTSTSPH